MMTEKEETRAVREKDRHFVHPWEDVTAIGAESRTVLTRGEGIYVIGFSYPVVPQGKARIRTQMSAAHEDHHVDRAVEAFGKVGRALGVIT